MMEPSTPPASTFSQHERVSEFQETCAPRQRALLSVLAVCDRHDLDPARFVASLSHDLPRTPLESRRRTRKFYWSRLYDFSETLERNTALPDGLDEFPGLLPDTVGLALRLQHQRGSLKSLHDAWLNRPPDRVFDTTRDDSFLTRMIPLFLKTLVILMLTTLILIFIIPQFKEMLEEFRVTIPPIFRLTVKVIDAAVKFYYVFLLLLLVAIPFSFRTFARYFRRWNPFIWQQPKLPEPVSTRLALALIAERNNPNSIQALSQFSRLQRALDGWGDNNETGDTEEANMKQLDWDNLASRKIISNKEALALKMTNIPAVQAWLLQKSATTCNHEIESRGTLFTRTVVTSVNAILCLLVLLLALTVFSTLISIMSHLI